MNSTALLSALRTACLAPLALGSTLTGATALRLGYLCLALFTALSKLLNNTQDPRLIIAQLTLTERFAQQLNHAQLTGALMAEVSGAHALSMESYTALRKFSDQQDLSSEDPAEADDHDALFSGVPELITGRTCYANTAEVLAAWLGISFFEAKRRIDDAHLLIGRRTAAGSLCEPRMPHLAALYEQAGCDRRAIAATARKLEKLEPEDTTFEGIPTELVAHGIDGKTLEESAAQKLAELGPLASRKLISRDISIYQELHGKKIPPKLGFFIGKVVHGTHLFYLRTDATDAQYIHSVLAQAGNPRTKAGQANRKAQQHRDDDQNEDLAANQGSGGQQNSAQDNAPEPEEQHSGTGQWMESDEPMPPWASDPDETAEAEESAEAHAEDTDDLEEAEVDVNLRRLNAFMSLITAPYVGGKRKVVIPKFLVYIWLADLQNLAEAHGVTSNGVNIPPGQLRQLLAKAEIIPLVLGGNSQPLDMGRKMRYHQGPIRMAIMARDRGCIVPDCTAPPDSVESDHYKRDWADGGETSVWSGAGLCTPDHHKRHAGQLKVLDVDGLPHVILPEHLDPEQKPRRNTYWGARQAGESPTHSSAEKTQDPEPPTDS